MDLHVLETAARLSDADLVARVKELAAREREATVVLIAHLAELDARRLYLAEGFPSLFAYCTDALHLSEHAAYNRIETARAVRRFPVLLEHLAAGWVTLFAARLLAPHLTVENHRDILALARHKTRRELEELIARLRPQPSVPDVIRRLPARWAPSGTLPGLDRAQKAPDALWDDDTPETTLAIGPAVMPPPAGPLVPPARRAVVRPLAPARYKVQFTAGTALHAKLREAQALLRHQIPDGDLEQVFDRALDALLTHLHKQKLAAATRPREHRGRASGARSREHRGRLSGGQQDSSRSSRHIPAAVRRTVWTRDGGRCAFVSADGRRCAEEGFLEFHHVVPYARGGPSTVDNIELRCRAHNDYEAARQFGQRMAAVREQTAVYAPAVPAVGEAAVPGDRSIQLVLERVPTRVATTPLAPSLKPRYLQDAT